MMTLEEIKRKDIKEFLDRTGSIVLYDGSYILYRDNKPITTAVTTEELYSYIIGWNHAEQEFSDIIAEYRNRDN